MVYLLQQIVTGLSVGGTYALVALGFVLYFGVLNILNIAHAQTLMLAPLLVVVLMEQQKLAWAPALLFAVGGTLAFSYVVYLACMKPFTRVGREAGYLTPFIASFGVSMLVENLATAWLGSQPLPFPRIGPELWRIGAIVVSPTQVISLGVTALLVGSLAFVVNRTAFGRAMRAVAENRSVAEAQGISADRTTVATVLIATLLGVVAGLLFAAGTTSVSAFVGLEYGLKGLVAMIIGGVTSLTGALVAALLLGLLETGITAYVSSSYQDTITYGLLFLILLVRPQGLFAILSREGRP